MRFARSQVIWLTAIAITLLLAAPTLAQQAQVDLRRENQRLRAEAADLTRELEAAKAQIERLRKENQALRAQLAAGSGPATNRTLPPLPPEKVSLDQSEPTSSPRALLAAVTEDYGQTTADLEMGTSASDARRIAYMRHLERWVKGVNRKYHGAIEWPIKRIEGPFPAGHGFQMRAQVVDPETDVLLGDPFVILVATKIAHRLERIAEKFGEDAPLRLKGTLVPRVRINDERVDRGPFDNPRFIGPFAEFNMSVVANAIIHQPPKPEDDADGAPDRGQGSAGTPAPGAGAKGDDGDRP